MKSVTLATKYINSTDLLYKKTNATLSRTSDLHFVGHSLGGALAKLYGYRFGALAVALSAPGIDVIKENKAFEPKVVYNGKNVSTSTNFAYGQYSVAIQSDIIPDNDLVPRLEHQVF
jgi:alpha-beta hydrolase superfamily lysophospholipase